MGFPDSPIPSRHTHAVQVQVICTTKQAFRNFTLIVIRPTALGGGSTLAREYHTRNQVKAGPTAKQTSYAWANGGRGSSIVIISVTNMLTDFTIQRQETSRLSIYECL